VITCAATGQDGDTLKGAPLVYVDNGDGTITNVNTGLMWEKVSQDGSVHDVNNRYTWDTAFSGHVAELNGTSFAGHTDWRLPNVRELATLANYENYNPGVSAAFNTCTSGCTVLTGSCTSTQLYWSSSTLRENPFLAWVENPLDGGVFGAPKSQFNAVRAVPGGS